MKVPDAKKVPQGIIFPPSKKMRKGRLQAIAFILKSQYSEYRQNGHFVSANC